MGVHTTKGTDMELPQRSAFPPAIPQIDQGTAETKHRDGFSCKTTAAYVSDANGHQRWCADCGEKLGEQAWAEGGADVSARWLRLAAAALVVVLSLVGFLLALPAPGTSRGGPVGPAPTDRVLPSPYGPPGAEPPAPVCSLPRVVSPR